MLTGGTDVHLVLVDLRDSDLDGKAAEDRLHSIGITVNRNAVPFDPRPPMVTSGLRIGTPALATRGFTDRDFVEVADIIADRADRPGRRARSGPAGDALSARVTALASDAPALPGARGRDVLPPARSGSKRSSPQALSAWTAGPGTSTTTSGWSVTTTTCWSSTPRTTPTRSRPRSASRRVNAILCTHGHNDHIDAAPALADLTGAPIWLHPADAALWGMAHPVRQPDARTARRARC